MEVPRKGTESRLKKFGEFKSLAIGLEDEIKQRLGRGCTELITCFPHLYWTDLRKYMYGKRIKWARFRPRDKPKLWGLVLWDLDRSKIALEVMK